MGCRQKNIKKTESFTDFPPCLHSRLVAAKTFYFGVGGDILSFRRLIEKDGAFDVKVVFSAQAFVRREILELTFKA